MNVIEAIETIEFEMVTEVNRLRAHLSDETRQIQEKWAGLGRANGQREDHAATLLGRLRIHLRSMAEYCLACEGQIDDYITDPFKD